MKKQLITLMMIAMAAVPAFGITAFASEPVVNVVTETDPDPFIGEMTVIWYDENGNEYRQTLRPKKEEDTVIQAEVSWSDEAGNRYVNNGTTVTIYDADGNVIGTRQA